MEGIKMSECGCGCSCGSGQSYVRAFRGPAGAKGDAATITIGKVTTGTEAKVTNTGTSTDAVLDFVIPTSTASGNRYGLTAKVTGDNLLSTYLRVSQDDGSSWQDAAGDGALALTLGDGLKLTDNGSSGNTKKATLEVDMSKVTGLVKSVNDIKPDDNGNVELDIPTITDDPDSEAVASDKIVPSCYMVHQLLEKQQQYVYDQTSATSDMWVINHNLGYYPNVTVTDAYGMQIEASVQYVSKAQVIVTFNTPTKGYAYLS
jgi:hypothetical protein